MRLELLGLLWWICLLVICNINEFEKNWWLFNIGDNLFYWNSVDVIVLYLYIYFIWFFNFLRFLKWVIFFLILEKLNLIFVVGKMIEWKDVLKWVYCLIGFKWKVLLNVKKFLLNCLFIKWFMIKEFVFFK